MIRGEFRGGYIMGVAGDSMMRGGGILVQYKGFKQ